MARGGFRPGAGRKKNQFSPQEINNIRARIKSAALIKRLQAHIDGDADIPASAVTAALGLLKKIVPDLAAIQLAGEDGGPIKIEHLERVIVDPSKQD